MADWAQVAKRLVRAEMARRAISYKELAERLHAGGGEPTTEKVLRTKVSRGGFSAAFFCEVMSALGARSISLGDTSGD